MELNDFIKKFKEHGFKETKSKSGLTIYLQKDMKDDDDDILVYCNNMSFFTKYIQISSTKSLQNLLTIELQYEPTVSNYIFFHFLFLLFK